jgi:RHH-type proline utilization regulon transcriptional repressor/proline dehydrogenase/delta 1-pyrroline-5-carboxylate dehydrogenase
MVTAPVSETFNDQIIAFGESVFRDVADYELSPLEIRFWNARMMEWSMAHPDLKVNLFRLVDVLPTLKSPEAIADHVRQYLTEPANRLHPALGWLVGLSASKIGTALTAHAVQLGVKQMASLFIAGHTPRESLSVLRKLRRNGYCFTVDLLGEFCVCEAEALEYQQRYMDALDTFGTQMPTWPESKQLIAGHAGELSPVCISVKLTALYSQTGALNFSRSVDVLSERLSEIVRRAKSYGALVYVDAEDSGNNPIIYETFKRVFSSQEFINFPYPGIVVQAYSRSAETVINELLTFARQRGGPIAIRLVKGAYWDLERVISSQNHWEFPLYEEKRHSDASYEHLTRLLLDNHEVCLPAFGSHNIRSLSHACCYAERKNLSAKDFEIQVLYGMAEPIAQAFAKRGYLTRMYVPLGELLPGMGYLVRRLLENTSNESFLRHTFFEHAAVKHLLRDPTEPVDSTHTITTSTDQLFGDSTQPSESVAVNLDY